MMSSSNEESSRNLWVITETNQAVKLVVILRGCVSGCVRGRVSPGEISTYKKAGQVKKVCILDTWWETVLTLHWHDFDAR